MGRDSVDTNNSKNELVEELISNVKMIEAKLEELVNLDDDAKKDDKFVSDEPSDNKEKVVTNIDKIEAKLKELIELDDKQEEEDITNKLLEYTSELKLADIDKEILTNIEKIEERLKELSELDYTEEEKIKVEQDNDHLEDVVDIEQENVEKISIAVVIGIVVVCAIVGSFIGYLLYKIAISNSDVMAMVFRYFI